MTPLKTPDAEEEDGQRLNYLGMHWDATEEHRLSQQLTNHKPLIE